MDSMNKHIRKRFSRDEKVEILKKTGGVCAHCGVELDEREMTVEHIFPLHKGGDNDEFNLIALCHECNNAKSNFIYDIEYFYKYILDEYRVLYYKKFTELKDINKSNEDNVFKCDVQWYPVLLPQAREILHKSKRRMHNGKKIDELTDRLTTYIKLERAYEGDCTDIYNFVLKIERNQILSHVANLDAFNNESKILNAIRFGDVYVLRLRDEICGVFAFEKIGDISSIVQLQNEIDNTILKPYFIMTFGYCNMLVQEAYNLIMNDFYLTQISNGVMPIYFNLLGSMYTMKEDIIMIPYRLNGIDGKIEFFTLKALEKLLRCHIEILMSMYDIDIRADSVEFEETGEKWKDGNSRSNDTVKTAVVRGKENIEDGKELSKSEDEIVEELINRILYVEE